MVMRDRVQERIAKVAQSMRSPATSELTTPEPVAPVKRLCRKCGRYFDGQSCTACALIEFLKDEPVVHESGWPCAVCGVTEAAQWHISPDNFKIHLRMVSRPVCHTCHVMRSQDKTPMRDAEEMWIDFRVAQELGLAGPWLERGAEKWVDRAHGLTRLFIKVTEEQRPMIAAELPKYQQNGPSRRPLWWLKLNKVMAEAYFAEYGQLKVLRLKPDTRPSYFVKGVGWVGNGDNGAFTGTKADSESIPYPYFAEKE